MRRPTAYRECLDMLVKLRAMGATSASVTVRGVEVAARFSRKVRDLQPVIGFVSSAHPADEVVSDDD